MKIAHLLSGGVDSSVALNLLVREGHEPTAFYLKIWLEDEISHLGECPWQEDLAYARQVCQQLDVALEVVPLQREYHDTVVSWALDELRAGRTPSPDVLCNQRVKFGAFLDLLGSRADSFDRISSGHYARLDRDGGRDGDLNRDNTVRLLRGVDPVKDQTYFLYALRQHQLAKCHFPLGELTKAQVRELAQEFDLPNQARPDSQGICFLGKIQYPEFVRSYLGEKPGKIRAMGDGRVLGEHRGFWFHTIGQRRGLGLGGGPWFVVAKDTEENCLWVCHQDQLHEHMNQAFCIPDVHWNARPVVMPASLDVRIRHTPTLTRAECRQGDQGLEVTLGEAEPGIAPGQSAVLYDGDICLGGGQIEALRLAPIEAPTTRDGRA